MIYFALFVVAGAILISAMMICASLADLMVAIRHQTEQTIKIIREVHHDSTRVS